MDLLKIATIKQYTSWDLNCRRYYNPKWASKTRKKIKRGARHSFKQILEKELKKGVDNLD